jgi:glutamyl/glutaminyl-tRNA synthetase
MIVSRFAPTPSGHLHLGNLLNFGVTWALTRRAGGKLWLRLDDHDEGRVRQTYIQDVLDNLAWLGLDWDERMPSQTTRHEAYRARLAAIPHYVCDCTRAQIQARTELDYDGHCRERGLDAAASPQRRWRSPNGDQDVVLWRRDDLPGYHLVSVADDVDHGVNLVVRGEDLLASSHTQLALAAEGGLAAFRACAFVHHPLLRGPDGGKLSKSAGAYSLVQLRAAGFTTEAVWVRLSELAGVAAVRSPQEWLKQGTLPWLPRPLV